MSTKDVCTWKRGRLPPPLCDGRGQISVSSRPSSSRPSSSSPLSVIPPFVWVDWRGALNHRFSGCRLARTPDVVAHRTHHAHHDTRDGFTSPSSHQMLIMDEKTAMSSMKYARSQKNLQRVSSMM